jgi:8-amino-7-oxononanoate synthase
MTEWIEETLCFLQEKELYRSLCPMDGFGSKIVHESRSFLNFAGNGYLDFSSHPEVIAASVVATEQFGTGATASRSIVGTSTVHNAFEEKVAQFLGYPSALCFGSGYLTNLGCISAVVGRNDAVILDKLVHASIVDAAVTSRAQLYRFRHNDMDHLDSILKKTISKKKLIVTESIFSMDGDLCPLRELCDVAKRHNALVMVDEAHALGVFGPSGRGCVNELHLNGSVDLLVGTMSKALGSYGGFVACSNPLRELLINTSRSFIYSTALPVGVIAAASKSIDLLLLSPLLGKELLKKAAFLRGLLNQKGVNTLHSCSHIVPVVVGSNKKAVEVQKKLYSQGIIAIAIRPPTVPEGTARIRLSVHHAHTEEELLHASNLVISSL